MATCRPLLRPLFACLLLAGACGGPAQPPESPAKPAAAAEPAFVVLQSGKFG